MTKTVVIAQARMGSSRLPGKVLMDLAGRPVLDHVLQRAAAIQGVDEVCCATTDLPDDDAVAVQAERSGVTVFRGSAQDVLLRYHGAASVTRADVVMRITCDCPLIAPEICADVLALRDREAADYACNNMPPSWPHGLDCEAFTFAALDQALHATTEFYDHEHVTPWIRRQAIFRKANLAGPGGTVAEQRWTLDYPEDLAFLRQVYAAGSGAAGDWSDTASLVSSRPELAAINMMRREKRGLPAAR